MANGRDNRRTGQKIFYALLTIVILAALIRMPVLEVVTLSVLLVLVVITIIAVGVTLRWGSTTQGSSRRDAVGKIIKFVEGYVPSSPSRRFREEAQAVAAEAMARAGHVIAENSIHLHDIGLLVYDDLKTPKIYRTSDIPTDAAYIRPYILLSQPEMPGASGSGILRFSLVDGKRKLRYTSRDKHLLHPGQNLVTPPTWLPLANQQLEGTWMLHVTLGSTPLAIINFEWMQVGGAQRARFNGDGEIDARMLKQLGGPAQTPLSLDELLADQRDVEIEGIEQQSANSRR